MVFFGLVSGPTQKLCLYDFVPKEVSVTERECWWMILLADVKAKGASSFESDSLQTLMLGPPRVFACVCMTHICICIHLSLCIYRCVSMRVPMNIYERMQELARIPGCHGPSNCPATQSSGPVKYSDITVISLGVLFISLECNHKEPIKILC